MAANLVVLLDILKDSILQIDSACKQLDTPFPSLDTPYSPESEAVRSDPSIAGAIATVAAAAEQLLVTVLPPARTLFNTTAAFQATSALRVATMVHVAEHLRDAGEKGAHVDEIVKGAEVSSQKLGRILRLLATKHIFREVSPDVFVNNRISSVLDTGKSVTSLRADPDNMHADTNGTVALVMTNMDEYFKGSAYLAETLLDPTTARSDETSKTAMNRAFGSDVDYWSWLELPEQRPRLLRFGMAMHGAKQMSDESFVLRGFDWKSLAPGSTVVDVGGGVGSVSLGLAETFPHLKIVLQDREKTIEDAQKLWQRQLPGAVASGQAILQPHDFFQDQPAREPAPAVFLIRYILHDWADSYCRKILGRLRQAAGPHTRLLVVDEILPYACRMDKDEVVQAIPGAEGEVGPQPLLANLGYVNLHKYLMDLTMLGCVNGQERTLLHFHNLLQSTGWKLQEVHRNPAFASTIVAVPI
ncbi:S-adenosyl-L-methionine-dependent methyltransferase [Auricularia subglabra TFB-10046 SS5]|nr:S-adenosyl-L-methionine-dependent methyltransferase [Auricularia subglabra TFB-10046 SS5]